MHQRSFNKLKSQIENLFSDNLDLKIFCYAYRICPQHGDKTIPRFYLKLKDKIIWDFPKDFPVKDIHFEYWQQNNNISNIIREYIDTPIGELLYKEFQSEKIKIDIYINEYKSNSIEFEYKLTELFKAADRRFGKMRLQKWAKNINSPIVDKILIASFNLQPTESYK